MENLGDTIAKLLYNGPFLMVFLLWSMVWKGLALWRAAGKKQLIWFLLIMVINTLGVLEIAYIFFLNKYDLDGGRLLAFLNKNKKKQ